MHEREFIEDEQQLLEMICADWLVYQNMRQPRALWMCKQGEEKQPNIRWAAFHRFEKNLAYLEEKGAIFPFAIYKATKLAHKTLERVAKKQEQEAKKAKVAELVQTATAPTQQFDIDKHGNWQEMATPAKTTAKPVVKTTDDLPPILQVKSFKQHKGYVLMLTFSGQAEYKACLQALGLEKSPLIKPPPGLLDRVRPKTHSPSLVKPPATTVRKSTP